MKTKKLLRPKRKGFVIAVVVCVLLILSIMSVGLANLGLQGRLLAQDKSDDITAKRTADAGITMGLFTINETLKATPWVTNLDSSIVNQALENCDATFSYTFTGDFVGGYELQSVGRSGNTRATSTVNTTLQVKGLFEYAIFTKGGLELNNGTVVDWYNYGANDSSLKLGTNSTGDRDIILRSGVTVNGDVAVGVGSDPADVIQLDSGATITGETYAVPKSNDTTPITVPTWLQSLPSQGDITGPTTITSNGKYRSIDLGNSETITIDGAVTLYVTESIGLNNSAELQVVSTNPDASLTLYLGGNFIANNGAFINNLTQDPTKLKIYGVDNCVKIEFKAAGDFYGAIYAPNADVLMRNSVNVFGAIIANSFVQNQSATFMYDASLREVSPGDEGFRLVIKRWSEQ